MFLHLLLSVQAESALSGMFKICMFFSTNAKPSWSSHPHTFWYHSHSCVRGRSLECPPPFLRVPGYRRRLCSWQAPHQTFWGIFFVSQNQVSATSNFFLMVSLCLISAFSSWINFYGLVKMLLQDEALGLLGGDGVPGALVCQQLTLCFFWKTWFKGTVSLKRRQQSVLSHLVSSDKLQFLSFRKTFISPFLLPTFSLFLYDIHCLANPLKACRRSYLEYQWESLELRGSTSPEEAF